MYNILFLSDYRALPASMHSTSSEQMPRLRLHLALPLSTSMVIMLQTQDYQHHFSGAILRLEVALKKEDWEVFILIQSRSVHVDDDLHIPTRMVVL